MLRTALRYSTQSFRIQVATTFVRRSDQPFSAEGGESDKGSNFDGSSIAISVANFA